MAAINGMYAPQGAAASSQRMMTDQMQVPNIILREINNTHADFVLENCDLRCVYLVLTLVLPTLCVERLLRMCRLLVCNAFFLVISSN